MNCCCDKLSYYLWLLLVVILPVFMYKLLILRYRSYFHRIITFLFCYMKRNYQLFPSFLFGFIYNSLDQYDSNSKMFKLCSNFKSKLTKVVSDFFGQLEILYSCHCFLHTECGLKVVWYFYSICGRT